MRRSGFINLYILLGVLAIIAVALAIVARNWSCRKEREPWRDPIQHLGPYKVRSVISGCAIEVEKGLRGHRTDTANLAHITIPEKVKDESQDHLAKLTGDEIRLDVPNEHWLRREELRGVVFGEGGANLNLEQLRAGMAVCEADATADMKSAEKEAKKAKRGYWKAEEKTKKHWFREEQE
jgi:endonuclease YncB( thermonuclease family)